VFNFHYATPPDAVAMNYGLNRVIGDNETGFHGTNNFPYRAEAWDFMLAGGGLFNHLDYSFVAGHEDGTFVYPATQPGGGNTALRKELRILRDFLTSFDFLLMRPSSAVIKGGIPLRASARALVQPGTAIAIYLRQSVPPPEKEKEPRVGDRTQIATRALQVELAAGRWQAEWIHPQSGRTVRRSQVVGGGVREIEVPPYDPDIALRLKRR
jgi:hypothetical protein